MMPLLLAMPFGPFLAWKRGDLLGRHAAPVRCRAGIAILALAAAFAFYWRGPWLAPFGIALGVWIVAGALSEWATRVKLFARRWPTSSAPRPRPAALGLRHAAGARRHRPRGARHRRHPGLAERERRRHAARRQRTEIAGYELAFRGVAPPRARTTRSRSASSPSRAAAHRSPSSAPPNALYDAPRQTTTEAAIHVAWRGDLYVVLGDELRTAAASSCASISTRWCG